MLSQLSETPLFSGSGGKIKEKYDFSDSLSLSDVKIAFSGKKILLDEFISQCANQNDDPNIVINSLIELYNKNHSNADK